MASSNSSLNPWVIHVTIGLSGAAGFLAGKLFGDRKLSANAILRLVINDFKKEGPITGSWIDYQARPFQRFAVRTQAYQGGITRQEDDRLTTYRFLADAYTGSILEMKRVPNA